MDDDTLDKFVANMRAAGQSDEMIADSLLGAGHNELMVLNALGIEHLSQLSGEDDEDDEPTPAPVAHAPSALSLTDESGNPLISDDNMPKAIGVEPQPAATAPAKPIDRSKPPRERSYPRPAPRRSTPVSKPKDSGFTPQTQSVDTPNTEKPDMDKLLAEEEAKPSLQQLGRKGIASQIPHHVAAHQSRSPKQIGTLPSKSSGPKVAPLSTDEKKKYGHHTFDDFMGRIESHPELPASTNHTLESDAHHEVPAPDPEPAPAPPPPPEPVATPESAPTPQGPESIDALLHEQKEEAAVGDAGPDMDELLDKKYLEELEKTPAPAPAPAAVDLKTAPETPQIAQVGRSATDLRNSLALKIVVILIGVLTLVGLAASIITQISG